MAEPDASLLAEHLGRYHLLVVDDDPGMRRLLARSFPETRFRAATAATAREAVGLLKRDRFDLAILDLILAPGPDGLFLLRTIKANPATRSLPVIAVTGDEAGPRARRSLELGAASCLYKPLDLGRLRETARSLLSGAGRGSPDPGTPRILYVEDDPEWQDLVRFWLREAGYSVDVAPAAKELRSLLNKAEKLPACVILDLGLPDGDGLRLCVEIKASPRLQTLPLIVFTSHPELHLPALSNQALGLVPKSPKAREELLFLLSSVLAQQRRSRGIVEYGDLRLDLRECRAWRREEFLVTLSQGFCAMLKRLLESSPCHVPDEELRRLVLERPAYERAEPDDPSCRTLDNYISRLRGMLGDPVGRRIQRVRGLGYSYFDPAALPVSRL